MKRSGRLCQQRRPQCASVQKTSLIRLRLSFGYRLLRRVGVDPDIPCFRPNLFSRYVDIAKILLRELRNRSVRLELCNRRVQALLQRGVVLADTKSNAAAE